MLSLSTDSEGKTVKRPTAHGIEIGITTELRHSVGGDYIVVLYNRNAQQFIIDNIDSIIASMAKN